MKKGAKRKGARGRSRKEPTDEASQPSCTSPEENNKPEEAAKEQPEENNKPEEAVKEQPEEKSEEEPKVEPNKKKAAGGARKKTRVSKAKPVEVEDKPAPEEEEEDKPAPAEEPKGEPKEKEAAIGARKRSRASKANLEEEEHKAEPSKKGKRSRVSKPEKDTEYFQEKRNLEDLWKHAFPVGLEWDQMQKVYQYNWNFSNLEDAFEEGGELYNKRSTYLVLQRVVSPFPPSDKIGVTSVQCENEEIIPMKEMKMDWVPYIPLEQRESQVERLKKSQIFILGCTQRRAGLKHLKVDRVKKFEYCIPYFYNPLKEDELEQNTEVEILFPLDPPLVTSFDWEMDKLSEFVDQLIEDESLPADQKEPFKDFVKQKVRETRKAYKEAKEARNKALEEMSPETKAAYENMRFYKFYPVQTTDTPDLSGKKSSFINRYYGKAHQVL